MRFQSREEGVDWKGLAVESLLELQWWRQEYGPRPVSYATRLALLQPDRSFIRRSDAARQRSALDAVRIDTPGSASA